jgi:phosphotriesterase-related protein
MSGVIRTISGDIPVERAGIVYAHEHLIIDTPLVAQTMPHIHLPSVEEAVAEVRTCLEAGVGTMVDAMPAASGRHPDRLLRIARATGIQLVAATGLHTERYYERVRWAREESAEGMAERFVADIEHGIDRYDHLGDTVERTAARAGVVKVASMSEEFSARDERLFEAAAITHSATGAPILTHTEGGRGGFTQIERLLRLGVAADRIALSHTDKIGDLGYHRAMAETGVFLCYDQGLRDFASTATLLAKVIGAGFAASIVVGTDGARRSLWATLGGRPGLAALYRSMGGVFDPDLLRVLFVDNPGRFLTLASHTAVPG